jgi:RNA polymerase sigma-70 factor (ECF subfamily)
MTLEDQRPRPEDERSLLDAARAGDERAFGSLAGRHQDGLELYRLLMLGCPDKAHDVVHEALLRGWRGLAEVAPSASVRIWLYRLATDVCLENLQGTDEFQRRPPFDPVNDDDRSNSDCAGTFGPQRRPGR